MRRGLKCRFLPYARIQAAGHTEFPDEEGTEIARSARSNHANLKVTPNSPMRRGLKFEPARTISGGFGIVTPNSPMRRGLKCQLVRVFFSPLEMSHRIPR